MSVRFEELIQNEVLQLESNIYEHLIFCFNGYFNIKYHYTSQGRIQDFKLGGAHLKKTAPSGGRRENF